jgi:sugar/nucleoside kinase (ribokinase family)
MSTLTESLAALKSSKSKITMFADGFVDEVWEIVSERASLTDVSLYTKMNQFADRITGSGSGGVGLELLRKRRAFGGFTANIGYAAARLGVNCSMVGVYGASNNEQIDPIFKEVDDICEVISLADAAVTHVFEFDDGKILMSHMEAVLDITWKKITDYVGMDKINNLLKESDIIGIGYWSLLPAFDEILESICAAIPDDGILRRFFFDFADFRKKDSASLSYSLGLLKKYNGKFPMTLSVNEHEAAALFAANGETLDLTGEDVDGIKQKTELVRGKIGLDEFVIHNPRYAVAAKAGSTPAFAPSTFVDKPVRSAGAGDTFNGGYIAASLAGLGLSQRLDVANAAVGHFLRTAVFPEISHLNI